MDLWGTGDDGTRLIKINSGTGAVTSFASHGFAYAYAAGFTPDGTLWTLTDGAGPGNGTARLGKFDLTTGGITLVGGGVGAEMLCLDASPAGTLYSVGWTNNKLYSLNTTTGESTPIGATGIPSLIHDIAFDNSDTLWAMTDSAELWTINTATGAATFMVNFPGGIVDFGLAVNASDQFYLTGFGQLGFSGLWTLDQTTGATNLVGSIIHDISYGGADFEPESVIPLPQAGLTGMAGLALVAGQRRRRGG